MTSDERSGLTRRAVLRGAAAAGAASLVRPTGALAAPRTAPAGVFSRWVGTVAGESPAIAGTGVVLARRHRVGRPGSTCGSSYARAAAGGSWSTWAIASVLGHGPDRPDPAAQRRARQRRSRAVRRADLERPRRLRAAAQLAGSPRRAPPLRRRAPPPTPGARRPGDAAGPADPRRRPRPAADHRALGLGPWARPSESRPGVRHGQARVRPPQRRYQRLQRRRGPVDPAGDLRLSRLRPWLLGHRLQLRGRRVRPDLGSEGRRGRSAGGRRARRRLQPGVDRDGRARYVHRRRALAGGDRRARAPARLEALAPRRPRPRSRHRRGCAV